MRALSRAVGLSLLPLVRPGVPPRASSLRGRCRERAMPRGALDRFIGSRTATAAAGERLALAPPVMLAVALAHGRGCQRGGEPLGTPVSARVCVDPPARPERRARLYPRREVFGASVGAGRARRPAVPACARDRSGMRSRHRTHGRGAPPARGTAGPAPGPPRRSGPSGAHRRRRQWHGHHSRALARVGEVGTFAHWSGGPPAGPRAGEMSPRRHAPSRHEPSGAADGGSVSGVGSGASVAPGGGPISGGEWRRRRTGRGARARRGVPPAGRRRPPGAGDRVPSPRRGR